MEEVAADTVQDNAPPAYAVYMVDPKKQTWLIVAAPPAGFMYTDPVALQARSEPNAAQPTVIDAALAAQGKALIEVRSVYDTDGLQRMGEPMIAAVDLPAGCVRGIAQTAPLDAADTRASVADLARIKDPADPAYHCTPARFVRAFRASAPMAGMTGMREAIGETDFEPQQILGYAPVEPDGSFKLLVPADVPLGLAILDSKGRALQTHLNWIQVRPGERRTCDGCHSPRRGAALNSGVVVNTMPGSIRSALSSQHQSGETMASLRTRLDPAALNLTPDLVYSDIWADTTQPGVRARASINVRYTGNANAADDLATPAPVDGVINYPDHIAPIWARVRNAGNVAGAGTCTTCHADPARLDLRATFGGTGRMVSYEELLLGDPVIDPATGQPQTRLEDGVPVIVRGPALVENMASERGEHLAFEPPDGDRVRRAAQEQRRGAHRAPEPTGRRTRSRHAAQRGREARRHRMDGPGRPVLQRPQQEPERAPRGRAQPHRVRGQRAAGVEQQLRGLPPARRQLGRRAGRHLVPAQSLRAHRQPRG